MPLTELNHYFVRANDLEQTKNFYCDVLGFQVMPRPSFPFPGYWLGVNGKIQVHMGPRDALLVRHGRRVRHIGSRSRGAAYGCGVLFLTMIPIWPSPSRRSAARDSPWTPHAGCGLPFTTGR